MNTAKNEATEMSIDKWLPILGIWKALQTTCAAIDDVIDPDFRNIAKAIPAKTAVYAH